MPACVLATGRSYGGRNDSSVTGRVAGIVTGTVALLFAVSAHAETVTGSGGSSTPSVPAVPSATPGQDRGSPYSTAPQKQSARPVLTVFSASASAVNAGYPVVRFQIADRSRAVRVRLAFVSRSGGGTYRKNLGSRRTGITHAYTWTPPARASGYYRVRITARDPQGYSVVRATSVSVSPPALSSDHRFPVAGPHSFGGPDARFGAPRSGHTHQGQDIMAPSGTPVVAPHSGSITWVAYQATGAGYYLVLASDGEPYNYVFMHLLKGSIKVKSGDHVTTGQQIGAVGATGTADGTHLHFEVWDGPWYNGGHAIDPLPFLKQWPN
jgi:murein DD-endopeptidase MepM/ murein hydrolase activator NlpD